MDETADEHGHKSESESQAKLQERLAAVRARAQNEAAELDTEQRWSSVKLSLPDVRQRVAQIGGPALLDEAWPDSAVVAGGALATAWFGQHMMPGSTDVDVFVPDFATLDRMRALLEFLGYQVLQHHDARGLATVLEAKLGDWCDAQVLGHSAKYRRLQVVVHRHAARPKSLVRTFDLYCSEAYWSLRDPEHVFVSAAGWRDWCDKTCRGGRFGLTISQRRLDKYSHKGFRHLQQVSLRESIVNEAVRRWTRQQDARQQDAQESYGALDLVFHFWEPAPAPDALYFLWTPWIVHHSDPSMLQLELDPDNPAHRKLSLNHLRGQLTLTLVCEGVPEAGLVARFLLVKSVQGQGQCHWAVLWRQVRDPRA